MDGDLDKDFVAFNSTNPVVYIQDIDGKFVVAATDPFTTYSADFALADIDGDGKLDFIGRSGGDPIFYKGTGTTTTPAFESISTATTNGPSPFTLGQMQVADLNGDGKLDLVGQVIGPQLKLYINEGSTTVPNFTIRATDDLWPGLGGNVSAFALGDVDGDGDLDLVAFSGTQTIRYFRNDAADGTVISQANPNGVFVLTSAAENPFTGITNDSYDTPGLHDVDRDGDADLIITRGNGEVRYFENDTAAAVSRTVTLNITGVNDAPSVTSAATFAVAENSTAVGTATATDPEADALTWSLTGADAALFAISSTGVITFKATPDFEAPADVGGDNIYNVNVVANDGGLTGSKAVTITVTNANEAPAVTSAAAYSVAENSRLVGTATGADPDAGSVPGFSLSGADAALFEISAAGEIRFKAAPDFEAPADAGGNNIYDLAVVATDAGGLTGSKAVTITVTDVAGVTINGGNAGRAHTGTTEGDKINGKGGNDTLTGSDGADKLNGGEGNDRLFGGLGADTLKGGNGADAFVFNTALGSGNVDVVKDFRHDIDVLRLDDAFFAAIGSSLGSKEFYAKAGATAAHDKSDHIVYDTSTGNLYYDADGKGGAASVLFATLSSKPLLDHGDFAIV